MITPVISGDGIFSHVFIGYDDVEKSAAFYDVVLGTLGINNLGPFGNGWVLYGRESRHSSLHARATVKHLPEAYAAYLRDPRRVKKITAYTFI